MSEERFSNYDDYHFIDVINRFRDMQKMNRVGFFDIYEFENIIDYYIEQRDFKNAKDAAKIGINQHPNSSLLKLKFAQILIENGKPSEGLNILRSVEMLEYNNYELFLIKGVAFNLLGKINEAKKEFERAISISSDLRDEVIYNIALSFIQINKINQAVNYLLLGYEVNPENALIIFELAMCYERIDRVEDSIQYYLKYLDIDPFAENVWFSLGMLYSSLNKSKKALEAYDYALAINPDYTSAYYNKAGVLINDENYAEAIMVYRELLEYEENDPQILCYIGECYEKLGRLTEAMHYFEKSLESDKNFGDGLFGISMVFFDKKRFIAAERQIHKALKVDPENSEYWFMLGEIKNAQHDINKALEAYDRTIELDPNDYEAWLAKSGIFFNPKKPSEAIEILQQAYRFNYDISSINYQLAAYYYFDNNTQKAEEYFEKGLSLNYKEYEIIFQKFPRIRDFDLFRRLILKYKFKN